MLLPSCGCHLVVNVENQDILQIFIGTQVTQFETGAVSSHCIQKLSWVTYFFFFLKKVHIHDKHVHFVLCAGAASGYQCLS